MKTIFTLLVLFSISVSASASELFVRINRSGAFYAMVGLQTHYNNSNVFRFFDLPQGINEIKIYYNNSSDICWSGTINLDYNQRVVCATSFPMMFVSANTSLV